MKTTKNTFWKVLGMVAIALSLVSCGKDNNSGGSSSNWSVGVQNLGHQGQQYIGTIMSQQAQACTSRGGQVREFNIPVNVNGQGVAIGVTSEGSFAILDAATRQLRLRLCQDNGLPLGQPQIYSTGYGLSQQCNGVYVFNGLHIKAQVGPGYMFDFVFRNPFQMPNCNNNYQYPYTPPYGY